MIVAIDGPSGVGKSSISRYCAHRRSFQYINSGQYYRSIAHYVAVASTTTADRREIVRSATQLVKTIGIARYIANLDSVDTMLHNPQVDKNVMYIAEIAEVRHLINRAIRERIQKNPATTGTIIEGRDIGTVVYPDAAIKIFLTASFDERIRRREGQRGEGTNLIREYDIMRLRDNRDKNRAIGALSIADDAHIIDTTHLTFSQVCKKVIKLMSVKYNRSGSGEH